MKFNLLTVIAGFVFMAAFTLQTVNAQTAKKVSMKDAALIAHLVKEANRPGAHSEGDVYLSVTIGATQYLAELKSGKVVSQTKAKNASGGIYGEYAEVSLNLLDKSKQETAQGAGQLLRSSGGKWLRVALSEGDYQCTDLKGVSKSVLKILKVECKLRKNSFLIPSTPQPSRFTKTVRLTQEISKIIKSSNSSKVHEINKRNLIRKEI